MTTPEELDERLWRFWNAKALKQADRIEQLIKERDEAWERLDYWVEAQPEKDREYCDEQVARQMAEAKLAMAVEALREIAVADFLDVSFAQSRSAIPIARAVLAELEADNEPDQKQSL